MKGIIFAALLVGTALIVSVTTQAGASDVLSAPLAQATATPTPTNTPTATPIATPAVVRLDTQFQAVNLPDGTRCYLWLNDNGVYEPAGCRTYP